MHKNAVAYNFRLHSEANLTANVKTRLSNILDTNQIEHTACLKLIMMTVRLLETQALAFRGHKENYSHVNATIETCVEASRAKITLHKKIVLGA